MNRYEGKVALVTGASRGIGRAIALRLAREGASVLLLARNAEDLHEVAAQVAQIGSHPVVLATDLRDEATLTEMIATCRTQFHHLDLLVHSAGYRLSKPFRSLKAEALRDQLSVNVEGVVTLTRLCLPWISKGGSIVAISSIAAQLGSPGISAYAMSKGAIDALVRSLALELAPKQIRINAIAPGMVESDLTQRVFDMVTPEQADAIRKSHPLGIGRPEDIAACAAFLGSDDARWITGSVLNVDGGYSAGK